MKYRIVENLTIEKLGYGGVGIATLPTGMKVIVSGGILPGSVVDCKLLKNKKDYFEAQVVKIHSLGDSVKLQDNLCSHYFFYEKGGCGGCKWQILPYEKQLEIKYQIVNDSFRNIKDIVDKVGIQPVLSSPEVFEYRNKMEFTFGSRFPESIWNLGFNKQGDFATVVDVQDCRLISSDQNDVYRYIKDLCKSSGLPVYNKKTHEGFFRHLAMRKGTNSGQILINLVVAGKFVKESYDTAILFDELKRRFSSDEFLKQNVTTFIITFNDGLADIVKGQNISTQTLWGNGFIYEDLRFKNTSGEDISLNFRVSPFSFFQTNTKGAELLFSKAAEIVGPINGLFLDLYCGAGTIGLSFLKKGLGEKVIGIEIVEDAIEDAKYNAKINGLEKDSYFVAGKAEKLIFQDDYLKNNLHNINTVIIDPPRDGLHKDVVKFLIDLKKIKNFKLLYISCNPVTMSRDIQLLTTDSFVLNHLQPVDMFPHTHHIEMIGLLS